MNVRKGRRNGALSLSTAGKSRLVLRPAGRLSGPPQRRKAQGEPDGTDREAARGWRGVARRGNCRRRAGSAPVVDVALQGRGIAVADQMDRAKVLQRLRLGDAAYRHLTRAAAITVLVILGGIIISLVWGSLPALRAFGISFLYEEAWNPVTEKFGAIAPIYGTIVTSVIAMLIAVPVSLFIAVFLTELCPMWLRRPVGIAIELLA